MARRTVRRMASSYGQFCPVAVACEVLTERWTPLVLRELLAGSRRFNDLQRGVPMMSPSLLTKRLRTLERAGIVERGGGEYVLTAAGEDLRPIIEGIGEWGQRWSQGQLEDERLDATLLMWDMHRRIDSARIPGSRVVVHFQLAGSPRAKSRFWMVVEDGEVDLCLSDPGYEVDLTVRGHIRDIAAYWTGRADISELVRSGALELDGPSRFVRAFPTWYLRSPFADVPAAV
jgi:DNA-binding HxlR family transcriptional regulator